MPSVYEIVTNRIIQQLENNVIPWKKPWKTRHQLPVNWKTQKPYRGINLFLLEPGEYLSFKQVKEAGGRVKKGEKGHLVVFWKWIEKENEDGETESFPLLRYYYVFEINTQCEGIESKQPGGGFDHNPIEEAEQIVQRCPNPPEIVHAPNKAVYVPALDRISLPPLSDFENPHEYYSTLFHELIHSTGHPKRLNRPEIANPDTFGSESYSKEELVAEFGAAFLCAYTGIDSSTIGNSTAYIQGWLKALRNDKKLAVYAASRAQKAVDYILQNDFSSGEGEESKGERELVGV